jgi:hypothetical protein
MSFTSLVKFILKYSTNRETIGGDQKEVAGRKKRMKGRILHTCMKDHKEILLKDLQKVLKDWRM